jgi:hypothetical protein
MKNILLVIACMFFVFRSFSQTRSELEESKKKSYEKIEYVNKLIEKNKRTKQQNYNTLVLLNKKIDVRNEIIGEKKHSIKSMGTIKVNEP